MVLKFNFEKDFELKFRKAAMSRYGYEKGALKKATKDALSHWLMQQSSTIKKVDEPFTLVEGILRGLKGKKTSVELQHGAARQWQRKY